MPNTWMGPLSGFSLPQRVLLSLWRMLFWNTWRGKPVSYWQLQPSEGEVTFNLCSYGTMWTFIGEAHCMGLSKLDRPNHDSSHIFVPAFPEDKLLDPKRWMYWYLKFTEQLRTVDSKDMVKLFLATKKPHKPVSSHTISKWIVNCYIVKIK